MASSVLWPSRISWAHAQIASLWSTPHGRHSHRHRSQPTRPPSTVHHLVYVASWFHALNHHTIGVRFLPQARGCVVFMVVHLSATTRRLMEGVRERLALGRACQLWVVCCAVAGMGRTHASRENSLEKGAAAVYMATCMLQRRRGDTGRNIPLAELGRGLGPGRPHRSIRHTEETVAARHGAMDRRYDVSDMFRHTTTRETGTGRYRLACDGQTGLTDVSDPLLQTREKVLHISSQCVCCEGQLYKYNETHGPARGPLALPHANFATAGDHPLQSITDGGGNRLGTYTVVRTPQRAPEM